MTIEMMTRFCARFFHCNFINITVYRCCLNYQRATTKLETIGVKLINSLFRASTTCSDSTDRIKLDFLTTADSARAGSERDNKVCTLYRVDVCCMDPASKGVDYSVRFVRLMKNRISHIKRYASLLLR